MLFSWWQISRISNKHEEKITYLSIQSIKIGYLRSMKMKKQYRPKQTSDCLCVKLPHWPTLLSPDCVFEDETIAAAVLIKTVSFLWEKKIKNKSHSRIHRLLHVSAQRCSQTDTYTCIHAHTEKARGATGMSGSAEARAETEELIEVVCFTPGSLLNAMSPQCHGE